MDRLVSALDAQYPCRTPQLMQLAAFISQDDFPSPPSITVHGAEATGKTLVLRAFLEESKTSFSWIPCEECISTRQLAERILRTALAALGSVDTDLSRCENVNALAVQLRGVLQETQRKHFLVLDRIDRHKEATPTLITALVQLGEMIPNLTVIFVITGPRLQTVVADAIPHIQFTPYDKEESIEILCKYAQRMRKLPAPGDAPEEEEEEEEELTEEEATEELWVWRKFCGTVWDSMAKGAARNIVQFRDLVNKMWLPFVQPIVKGEYGTRNYSSLYLYHKDMFRSENNLIDSVILLANTTRTTVARNHDLPYYSKFILCAAYLASYNPARLDTQFFVKASETKRRRRGGGGKRNGGQKSKKIARRLLGPSAFVLERMLAIFHAITPQDVPSSVDIQSQVATLTSLRLLMKTSVTDPLEGSTKWKVNVGWDYIRGIARSLKFDIEDFLAES